MTGNHNVFAAAADEGVQRLVFASSASVYGEPKRLPMHEDDELAPLTPYCIAKRAGEDLLSFYQRNRGLSWNALRFFNVYGPGQKIDTYYTSVISHFIERLRNGQPPIIDGRGEQSMDFVHVHDLAPTWPPRCCWRRSHTGATCRSISAPAWTPRSPPCKDPHRRDRDGHRTAVQPA